MGKEPGIYKKFVRKLYIVSENCWKIIRKLNIVAGNVSKFFFENCVLMQGMWKKFVQWCGKCIRNLLKKCILMWETYKKFVRKLCVDAGNA